MKNRILRGMQYKAYPISNFVKINDNYILCYALPTISFRYSKIPNNLYYSHYDHYGFRFIIKDERR